jgi:tail sheath protein
MTDIVETVSTTPGGGAAVVFSGPSAVDADFSLSNLSSSYLNGKQVWAYVPNLAAANGYPHQAIYQSASLYKFGMAFRGGHDGWDPRVIDPLYLNNTDDETLLGVVSLKRAIDCIANPDAFDMNVLTLPGINNLKVTDYGRTMVNNRQDAIYIMDVTGASVTEVVGQLQPRNIDDNYTACYYPDLKLNDLVNKKMVRVSPSVAVAAAYAYSDRVAQPWFAPAGLNRGGLGQFDVKDVVDRLTFDDRNTLYDNRINPIATFPDTGISVFGQKTLQIKASALDRVNVRRLLIFAKKTIASAAKYLVFEPDSPSTWDRFTKMVNPILSKIQQDQGLERFKVVMDSTTNTPDVVDRNTMVGKIFLQPTKAAEFLDLSFVITNAGVQFGQ